ncbi:hypothetical protein H6F96_02440 [Microcoleus sp. FACHB-53]|nr:hypothetical protein [Microcoleus sp. FACHB-53]
MMGCLVLLIAISFKVGVLAQSSSSSPQPPTLTTAQTPDLGQHFKQLGLEGSILIYDSKQNRTYEHNPQRNATAMKDIDRFWLQGPLKITPKEQIEFLQRLYRNDLPFSQRTMNLVPVEKG